MIVLLDNTVLSNFAATHRAQLLQLAVGTEAATTPHVMHEFSMGVAHGRVPETDWSWLEILSLSVEEGTLHEELLAHLNAGEASCLAVAYHRQGRLLTDDRDARRVAGQMQIAVSGTLGMLMRLVQQQYITMTEGDALLRQMIDHGYRAPVVSLTQLRSQ